ncbi:MAG: flagellar export chaperone FliS [Opitutae bacterium]|nr:flagellar export chaperone FliS [Opitutae bacterium]
MVANSYARTYQAQAVMTASPGQLVLMLYDGALRFLRQARAGFELPEDDPRRIEIINRNLLKAQAIIDELQDTLDKKAGGEFAATMERLYDYHRRQLIQANVHKNPALLDPVEKFLEEIRGAWAEMLRKEESACLGGGVALKY